MGCSFSSPQLDGPVGGDGVAHYGFNLSSPDYFGLSGSFSQVFYQGQGCINFPPAAAYVVAPTTVYTCNTVLPTDPSVTIKCPAPHSALSNGDYYLSFSPVPTPGSDYYNNPYYYMFGPKYFEVDSDQPTETTTAYQCVAEYPPATCTPDAILNALKSHRAGSFCLNYLEGNPGLKCSPQVNQYPFVGLDCGIQGVVSSPVPLTDYVEVCGHSPSDNCRDSCLATMSCQSFMFDESSKQCVLYSQSGYSMGFTPSSSGGVFYNRNCFQASCQEQLPAYIAPYSPSQISSGCYCQNPTAAPPAPGIILDKRTAAAKNLMPRFTGKVAAPNSGRREDMKPRAIAITTPVVTPGAATTVYSGPDTTFTPDVITTTFSYTQAFCYPTVEL